MLLCRRLLFKTQIHKALVIIPICSHTAPYRFDLIRSTLRGYESFTGKANSLNIVSPERGEAAHLISELLSCIKRDTRKLGRHQEKPNTILSQTGAGAFKSIENAVDLYLHIRHLDRLQLKKLPATAFKEIARQVFKEKLYSIVDLITEDVVENFQDDPSKLGTVLLTLLKYACRMNETQHRRKLMIFRHLPNGFDCNSIPYDTLIQITIVILRQPQSEITQHIPFLEIAIPILLNYKDSNIKAAADSSDIGERTRMARTGEPPPNDPVWLTLCLVHFLTEIGDEERSLQIFQ